MPVIFVLTLCVYAIRVMHGAKVNERALADQGREQGTPPPPPLQAKISSFHTVCGENWSNSRLPPPPPPRICCLSLGNPESANRKQEMILS